MTAYQFDDRNIQWHKLGDFEHFVYSILDIDRENNIADVIFKFEPHQPIVLHRHKVLNKMLVIQGEHWLYEPNGEVKEVRPVGRYTSSPASPDPHRECGGDEGAVVIFSIRGNGNKGALYELLDVQENLIGIITMQDLIDLHVANN
jgi:quercetin dioxygenase-like cupin family protein